MSISRHACASALAAAFFLCPSVRAAALSAEDARRASDSAFAPLITASPSSFSDGIAIPTPAATAHPSAESLTAAAAPRGWQDILDELPPTSATKTGSPDSPVNLIFVGSEEEVRRAIRGARWTQGTTSMASAIARGIGRLAVAERADVFPPVSAEYLYGRGQDMGFLQELQFVRSRHHFRLWRAPFAAPDGRPVWVGTSSLDVSLQVAHGRVTHRIDPDLDQERDYILSTLGGAPGVDKILYVRHPRAVLSGRDSNGDPYRTDGRVLTLFFRS